MNKKYIRKLQAAFLEIVNKENEDVTIKDLKKLKKEIELYIEAGGDASNFTTNEDVTMASYAIEHYRVKILDILKMNLWFNEEDLQYLVASYRDDLESYEIMMSNKNYHLLKLKEKIMNMFGPLIDVSMTILSRSRY